MQLHLNLPKLCSVLNCDRPAKGRGWCPTHWARWKANGDPDVPRQVGQRRISREVLFWRKVNFDTPTGCWEWMGGKDWDGYGMAQAAGRSCRSSRMAYIYLIGPIPSGLQLDHLCRVVSCVNPWHLEPVTPKENRQRVSRLKTACRYGHPYNATNTHVTKEGWRICRLCARLAKRRRTNH